MAQAAELKHILANIEGCEEEEVDELVREFDKDGSGLVNYAEFVKAIFLPHVRPVVPGSS